MDPTLVLIVSMPLEVGSVPAGEAGALRHRAKHIPGPEVKETEAKIPMRAGRMVSPMLTPISQVNQWLTNKIHETNNVWCPALVS